MHINFSLKKDAQNWTCDRTWKSVSDLSLIGLHCRDASYFVLYSCHTLSNTYCMQCGKSLRASCNFIWDHNSVLLNYYWWKLNYWGSLMWSRCNFLSYCVRVIPVRQSPAGIRQKKYELRQVPFSDFPFRALAFAFFSRGRIWAKSVIALFAS